MSQMDQEQSGEVPQMCPLELEWVLPCLGTLHIKTVEKVRDSFQEGINWLASTAAVCATILNVCVRNRVGEFGRSHYIPSSSQFFFKSAKFLPAIIGSSHNFVVRFQIWTWHGNHSLPLLLKKLKNDGGVFVLCHLSLHTLKWPKLSALHRTSLFFLPPSTAPSLASLLPEAVH